MTSKPFEVVVIGAGPGGYIAAIRAAQLGFHVACVDEWKNSQGKPAPGGTCTNVGCIPSKALLQSSENYALLQHEFATHGITVRNASMNVGKMLDRKNQVVQQNNDGILYLFKKNKITFFHGQASFVAAKDGGYEIAVKGKPEHLLHAKQVVIATGSSPRALPEVAFDETDILSNDGALALSAVPKKLGVIGAGVIGVEMGSVWARLGAQVTMLETLPDFLPAADTAVAKEALKTFTKQGLNFAFGVRVESVKKGKKGVSISYQGADDKAQTLTVDKLIVSVGRIPNTRGLNAESIGLQLDERGAIVVNDLLQTNLPSVWAVGDVVRGPMLAHKAEEEGVAVAERMAGQNTHVHFGTIPWVIYTAPEIAWAGQTEQQLKSEGRAYKAGQFPFLANGRARAMGATTGFAKVLSDAQSDEVLGVHIIGPLASELIAQAVMAMEFKASTEDIARICYAHPTLSEAVKEAALAVDKRALNF